MDPGWDHTENEDKLLLAHTLRMGQDMAKNDNMYGTDEVSSLSTSGCNSDNMSTNYEIISLNTEYSKHLSSVVTNYYNHLNIILYSNLYYQLKINLNCLSINLSNIDKSIECCLSKVRKAVDMINCIIKLMCKCNTDIIKSFKNCLIKIKSPLYTLISLLNSLCYTFGKIICLKNEIQKIIKCNNDVSSLKTQISELIKKFICSSKVFKCIECQIKCVINKLKEIKQELCKQIDKFLSHICLYIYVTISQLKIKITYFNKKWLEKKLKCLGEKIDEICSEFTKINYNTNSLKYLIYKISNLDISTNVLQQYIFIKLFINSMKNKIFDHQDAINNNTANNNRLIKDIGVAEVDNQVVGMYSVMSVMDYGVLVNRLFKMLNKTDYIYNILNRVEYCQCLTFYNRVNKDSFTLSHIFKFSHEYAHSKFHTDGVKANDGNHQCLCIVTNYVLYPSLVKAMCYLMDCDLDTLSTLSRKFEKFQDSKSVRTELGQLCILAIDIIDMIGRMMNELLCNCKEPVCKCMRSKYRSRSSVVSNHGSNASTRDDDTISNELYKWFTFFANMAYNITSPIHQGIIPNIFKCYCLYHNNIWYSYFVSIMLVLSSLMENIWTMDTESVRMAIQRLSSLIREFDMIDSQNNKSTSNNNNNHEVFSYIINILLCKPDVCKLSSKLQFILKFLSLPYGVGVLDSLIKPYTYNISLFNIFNFENVLKHLRDMNISGTGSYFGHLLDKYKSIDGSNNLCSKFGNQCCVLSSNIVIIVSMLISVKINIKLYPKKCQKLKERLCCFLKSMCNCKDTECCLKNFLDSTSQICNGNSNNCDQLLKKCLDSCCGNQCCWSGCPCKEIKSCCDKLKELCCKSAAQNGLCKIIDEISRCQCKVKKRIDGGCICVCCKIVIKSIRILQNMFRSNLRIISKNVIVCCKYILEIIDKIKKTNNSDMILKSILESNNNYNKIGISLVKNNLITHPNYDTNYLTISNTGMGSSNWGYDTKYEHDVSTDKGFSKGDGYPYVSNRNSSNSMSSNSGSTRVFKKNNIKLNIP